MFNYLRSKQIRKDLDNENRHKHVKLIDCISNIVITKNTDYNILRQFTDLGIKTRWSFKHK